MCSLMLRIYATMPDKITLKTIYMTWYLTWFRRSFKLYSAPVWIFPVYYRFLIKVQWIQEHSEHCLMQGLHRVTLGTTLKQIMTNWSRNIRQPREKKKEKENWLNDCRWNCTQQPGSKFDWLIVESAPRSLDPNLTGWL